MRALWLLVVAGCIPLESEGLPKKNPNFLVVGHRGAPNQAAENTLASFDMALAQGANALEIDLCVTADGVVVVWHDRDPDETIAVARQQGIEGLLYVPYVPDGPLRRPVDELTLAELLASHGYARADDPDVRDLAAPIATFAEFLDWAKGQPELDAVYLDLKMASGQGDHAVQVVRQATGKLDVRFYALSVHQDIVERLIAEAAPGVRVAWDHEDDGALERSLDLGLRDLSIGLTALRSETAVLSEIDAAVDARADKRLDSITVWTIDSPMTMAVFLFHGVDAILTNDPARLYQIWQATL